MVSYKGVEYIPDENGVAVQVKCPLVDQFIEAIECIENTSVAETSVPDQYKKKPDWKHICQKCPFRDY